MSCKRKILRYMTFNIIKLYLHAYITMTQFDLLFLAARFKTACTSKNVMRNDCYRNDGCYFHQKRVVVVVDGCCYC